MDEQLGRLFDFVREDEALRENTLILICSDNGHERGAGRAGVFKGRKATLFEGGIRSPLIVWGPGLIAMDAKGTRNVTSVVAAIDLVPSLLALAQAKPPEGIEYDGEDLLETFLGESRDSRTAPLCFSRPPDHASHSDLGELPDLAARHGRWKLLCDFEGESPQLHDLLEDPAEARNLAEEHPEVTRSLMQTVTSWCRSMPE